jgi:hypothetical protein
MDDQAEAEDYVIDVNEPMRMGTLSAFFDNKNQLKSTEM